MTKQIDANWHYPEKGEYPVAFGEYKHKVYPQIPCLVFHRGRYGVRFWNCIEECWDEEDGDDFFCSKDSVEEWMYIDALEQKQPKVDLEKLLNLELPDMTIDEDLGLCTCDQFGNQSMTVSDIKEIARHFYKLGLNARKEE